MATAIVTPITVEASGVSRTTITISTAAPSPIPTAISVSGSQYSVTLYPTQINVNASVNFNGTTNGTLFIGPTEISTFVSVPTTSPAPTSSSNIAVPAALGAVLGVFAIISAILLLFLIRKNQRLRRSLADNRNASGQINMESPYHLKDSKSEGEEDPVALRQQLSQARKDVAALSVLRPSSIRDRSDYARQLTLLNDATLQLAMRISRAPQGLQARDIRPILCEALWGSVFSRFDAGLDSLSDMQLSWIFRGFNQESTAHLWKALTVQNLPLANAEALAKGIHQNLSSTIGSLIQGQDLVPAVQQSLSLARAVAEDGKGFTVVYVSGAQDFQLHTGQA